MGEPSPSDRAVALFRQMEAAFIEVAWMWAEVQSIVQQQEQAMKKVTLSLKIQAELVDADTGKVEPVPFDADMNFNYRGVPYADALDVQESFAQALAEHGQRMIAKGRKSSAPTSK